MRLSIALMTAALALALSAAAGAALKTGRTLLEECRSGDGSPARGLCLGYLEGVYDTIHSIRKAGMTSRGFFCPSGPVSREQLRAIVLGYLEKRPTELSFPADRLATSALARAYPCPMRVQRH